MLIHLKYKTLSLFKRLCDKNQEAAVCELGIQYRMCSDIMLLANSLVYNNKLQCANEGVARSVLKAGKLDLVPDFIRKLVPSLCFFSLVFVDLCCHIAASKDVKFPDQDSNIYYRSYYTNKRKII